jgi:hypothetical protein
MGEEKVSGNTEKKPERREYDSRTGDEVVREGYSCTFLFSVQPGIRPSSGRLDCSA